MWANNQDNIEAIYGTYLNEYEAMYVWEEDHYTLTLCLQQVKTLEQNLGSL